MGFKTDSNTKFVKVPDQISIENHQCGYYTCLMIENFCKLNQFQPVQISTINELTKQIIS